MTKNQDEAAKRSQQGQSYRMATERAKTRVAELSAERQDLIRSRVEKFRRRAEDIAEGRRDPLDG